ncbi:OmpH family outer membrane protein [Flavobacterium psychrotolerans]|uniref:Outer membrane protein beta-barrel domain-containing protein n=1 Tax=Flavobacterium psychrotolerans TaxID=2169410 RepID=A0A2U1JMW6_9FLAO|nr:OmpH family outer membrane protein [Flavobacterium psychrotolerans]PWA06507.1 hypothetical protein DB895_03565 [Flavobacterium psychrotolerans]
MRNFTIYLTGFLCLFLSKVFSQETFESRAKTIATKIENITKEEKAGLKEEIEAVNIELEKGVITKEQADEKKLKLAESRAKAIEFRISQAQNELVTLVQEKVDGKIATKDDFNYFIFSKSNGKNHDKYQKYQDSIKNFRRTTSQFVFALGLNNLATNKAVANSDYRYLGSHFYEWGVTANTRIFKNSNLLHAKYGMSVMYNNLRPTDNRYFVESGYQTNLESSPVHLDDSRFRNVYLVAPIHLEFDFSGTDKKGDKTIFKTHQSFRVGLGGYAGANLKSKQILFYEDSDGHDVKQRIKGNYNTTDFIYGASAYVGYKAVSLYAKYDISPLFNDNTVDQNNVSLGLRFDIN